MESVRITSPRSVVLTYRLIACFTLLPWLCWGAVAHLPHNDEVIWFSSKQPTISALDVLSLMADLGLRDSATMTNDELAHSARTGAMLTESLLHLNRIMIGHQVAQALLSRNDIYNAAKAGRLSQLIDQQLPQFAEVAELRSEIARMRQLTIQPWPKIDESFTPKLGQRHHEVSKVIYILVALRDMSRPSKTRMRDYTPEVIEGIRHFQQRHSLPVTGKLDTSTRHALARTPSQRLDIMQKNLWRWLSLPSLPPEKYIDVNIPSFSLTLYTRGRPVLFMPVIVGAPHTPTPIMLTAITSITENPRWVPPVSIVNSELLPTLRQSPGALDAFDFYWENRATSERVSVDATSFSQDGWLKANRLVQAPGTSNALGKWKFNIINNDAIYLHDTPVRDFFSMSERALSHGCVRLADAEGLAQALLSTIKKEKSGSHSRLLPSPVATYLNYHTVVIEKGIVRWLPDIYQLDLPQLHDMIPQMDTTLRN